MTRLTSRRNRRRRTAVAAALVVAFVATTVAAISAPVGASARRGGAGGGGEVTFALEAETDTTNGYCIPRSQLAAGGIQVVAAIYDTLVVLNAKGEYVPYLLESIEPNDTYDEWTLEVREGITFHDGSPLDAEVVKLNIDSFRGANPIVNSPLGSFALRDIASVDVTGPMTVVVKTKVPWVRFPAAIYGTGRSGISAAAQLNNPDTCATNMIGTGPFKLVDWRPNESLVVERNDDYWREGLPKLDRITFRPIPEVAQRVNGLQSGEYDLVQTSSSKGINRLDKLQRSGDIRLKVSEKGSETGYLMLNVSKPPFDDILARQAVAYAADAKQTNNIINGGINTLASGPFPPDSPVHLEKRRISHNLKKAKSLVAEYEQKTGLSLEFEYLTGQEPELVQIAQLFQEQMKKAGIEVSVRNVSQAEQIDESIAGSFQAEAFRNHPGGDPDTNYVWWHSGFPTNFGRINDPEIDRLLDAGRGEPDEEKRLEIYRELNVHFSEQLYNLWSWYTLWAVGTGNDIRGINGVALPDGQGKPNSLFAGVVPLYAITKT